MLYKTWRINNNERVVIGKPKESEVNNLNYPNLGAELARANIKQNDVAALLEKDKATISIWMNGGGTGFSVKQARLVRDTYFPGMTLDYLFNDKPIVLGAKEEQ